MAEMIDAERAINSRKPLKEPEKNQFQKARLYQIEDGTYDLKLLSHRDKCPDGFKLQTEHIFEGAEHIEGDSQKARDARWKSQLSFYCTETTHGLKNIKGPDGTVYLVPVKPCACCDRIEDFRRIDDGNWFTEELDEDYQRIIHNMSVAQQRNYIFPSIWYAEVAKEGFKVTISESDRTVVGLNLTLYISSDKKEKLLYNQIKKLVKASGDQIFSPDGMWLRLTKERNSIDLEVTEARKLTRDEDKLYKGYPNIAEWGKGVTSGNYQRPSKIVGYDRATAMMANSWWGKKLAKRHGYDWDDDIEGLACTIPPQTEEDEDDLDFDRKPKKKSQAEVRRKDEGPGEYLHRATGPKPERAKRRPGPVEDDDDLLEDD